MKIAVIGSREGFDETTIWMRVSDIVSRMEDVTLISGGARGVDSFVESWAKATGTKIEIIKPVNPSSKIDYLYRNIEIITKADLIIVFWDCKSRGTKFVIDYAKARGKEIKMIMLNKE